jgi:hypothetical protein
LKNRKTFCTLKLINEKIGGEDAQAHNSGFCNIGAEAIPIGIGSLLGFGSGRSFSKVAFCSYLHLQYFNWAAVPGRRISNPPTSQSPIVVCKARQTLQ